MIKRRRAGSSTDNRPAVSARNLDNVVAFNACDFRTDRLLPRLVYTWQSLWGTERLSLRGYPLQAYSILRLPRSCLGLAVVCLHELINAVLPFRNLAFQFTLDCRCMAMGGVNDFPLRDGQIW